MVREPGEDFFGCEVSGFVNHGDIAAESLIEPLQAIKDPGNFRYRIVVDRVKVFWRDVTQPVGNDDIAQVDDSAALLLVIICLFLRCR